MNITTTFHYAQALEIKSALEERIDKINRILKPLFKDEANMLVAYDREIEYLNDAIKQILGVSR
jgi:hypothetical protein